MPGAEQLTSRRADGESRLARDSLRRPVAHVASGRVAHGRQGACALRLRGPCRVPLSGTVREMRDEDLHRGLLRPGHWTQCWWRADIRPREMRPLCRVRLELRNAGPRPPGPDKHRLSRRDGRFALGVELTNSRAEFQLSHKCVWRIMRLLVVTMEK